MKRMIISPAQLKAINEIAVNGGQYNDVSDVKTKLPTLQTTGNTPITFSNSKPAATGGSVTMSKDDLTANTASSSDNIAINNATTFTVTNENRFSKRQVELGRMLEMRRTGKVFSKKQLNEMFMETQENADRLRQGIGGCKLHDIFDAIEEIFPEEIDGVKEAFMSGADLPEYICSIFSNEGINGEKEQAFLERLGI